MIPASQRRGSTGIFEEGMRGREVAESSEI